MTADPRPLAVLVTLLICGCAASAPAPPGPVRTVTRARAAAVPRPAARAVSTLPSDRAAVVHLLNRFTFGARPGDVDGVMAGGSEAWFSAQLDPQRMADGKAEQALTPYRDVLAPPVELPRLFPRSDMASDEDILDLPLGKRINKQTDFAKLLRYAQMAGLVRHVASERQVYEVMVDFWTNHFNVFARKGLVKLYVADYVERAIRPHALGRFEDLLISASRHPAMLIYLDNARSSVAKTPTVAKTPKSSTGNKKRGGITENHARELLELHTLGVNGGYSQNDVIEVARVLTGWSVARKNDEDLGFLFRERAHDRGEKTVLGQHFPAGRGEEEGVDLLRSLARHPSTARHLGRKLCQRFVADEPPDACVARVATAYLESGTDIKATLLAILRSPEFWATPGRRAKLKSPLEFMVSALRAVGAELDASPRLARMSNQLGEAPLLEPAPTGYPEQASDWANSNGALMRMSYASQLAAGKIDGVSFDPNELFGKAATPAEIVNKLNSSVLGGQGNPQTLAIISRELTDLEGPEARRTLALALALGSPDFQKQ